MMKKLLWTALAIVAPSVGWAQGPVTVGTNDTTMRRLALGAKTTISLVVDLSAAGAPSIDSIATSFLWNPGVITVDSVVVAVAGFGDLKNETLNRTAGLLGFDAVSTGPTAPSGIPIALATLYITATQASGGTRLAITPTDASLGGAHLAAGQLVGWSTNICVTPSGFWGDTNTSGTVDIMDAQQIAAAAVGADLVDTAAVANNGDINSDGVVDILDAQGIARFSVGLSTPNTRTHSDRGAIPDVSSLTINRDSVTLAAVGATTSLTATPFDANNFTLVGCQSVAWTSSDETKVHVNPTGQITGIASGTATITATWGTGPSAVSVSSAVTVR